MSKITVKKILDGSARSGFSEKTNKEWSMSAVELSNGDKANIFNPVREGDEVVVSGQYNGQNNYKVVKPDPKHEEIMKALRAIYKAVTTGEVSTPEKPAEGAPEQPDEVYDVDEKAPINLDDIPF